MAEAPPAYESTVTTRRSGISLNTDYPKSIPGIIKIAEIVLSIITFICSIVKIWHGHGWVEFVSFTAFLSALIYFLFTFLNIFSVINRFPGPWLLIEFIYCIIYSVFFLIAAIVAAVYAATLEEAHNIGATAFFAFMATAIFTVDTVYQYRAWSTSDSTMRTQTTTTTTGTTYAQDDRPKY